MHLSFAERTPASEVEMPAKRTSTNNKTSTNKRWVAKVKTDSTHPPEGLFTNSASMIARSVEAGLTEGRCFRNENADLLHQSCGRGIDGRAPRAELEKAKSLLSKKVDAERKTRERGSAKKKPQKG